MAVIRIAPTCPGCGEVIAKAIYDDQSQLPVSMRLIGDTFLRWEYFEHKCEKLNEMFQRFKKPTDQQLIDIAILFNNGKLQKQKLADMVAMTQFVLDRLHENADVSIPSSKES